MIPEAHVSHQIPRRLRIKIPEKKGDAVFFAAVADHLKMHCPGVEDAIPNPATGSIVVLYDGEIEGLIEYGRRHNLYSLSRPRPRNRSFLQDVAGIFAGYNRNLKKMTGGEVDIPSLVFLSLLISGIWQLARGNVAMPAWYTAFYYALGVFTRAKVEEFDEGEPLVGDVEEGGGELGEMDIGDMGLGGD
jgi:hypothetical protein